MVRIIVFVPSPDMLKPVQQQAAEWENDEISINVVHRFGTPEILYQLDNYDVIVARGITYNKICNIYPEKHITRLRFDGMDLVEALFQCGTPTILITLAFVWAGTGFRTCCRNWKNSATPAFRCTMYRTRKAPETQ